MSITAQPSRRSFLKHSAGAAAGLAALGVPAVQAQGANETLNIGCIGTGGPCRTLMKSLVKAPKVRIAALCDLYDGNLKEGQKPPHPKPSPTRQSTQLLHRTHLPP